VDGRPKTGMREAVVARAAGAMIVAGSQTRLARFSRRSGIRRIGVRVRNFPAVPTLI
jgi:hypothetical protein